MGQADYWLPGGWNMICAVCGFKYKNIDMKLRWDGVWVCWRDYELRQPQDFVRGVDDPMSVPYAQPEPPNKFLGTPSTPLSDIVVGTPNLFLNGVLQSTPAQYSIVLPQGQVTFVTPPAQGVAVQWTGTWLHSSLAQQVFSSPFQFALGDGFTNVFNIYWSYI